MPDQTINCPNCGARIYLTDSQCLSCGAHLDEGKVVDAIEPTHCPACGHRMRASDTDCAQCHGRATQPPPRGPSRSPRFLLPEIAFGVVFCGLCAVLGGLAGLCFGSMLACMFVGVPGYMGEEWGLALAVNALGGLGGAALGGIIGLVTALRRGRKHVVAICLLLAAALLFGLNWAVHSAMTRAKEAERRWGSLNGVVAQASRVALPANSDTSDEPHDAGGRHHPTGGRPTKWESPQHSPRSAACFCSLAPAFSRAAGAGRAAEAPKRVLTEALPELRREGKPAPLSTAPLRQETQRR